MPLNCNLLLVLCVLYFALYNIRWYTQSALRPISSDPAPNQGSTSHLLFSENWATTYLSFEILILHFFLFLRIFATPSSLRTGIRDFEKNDIYRFLSPPPLWELSNNQSALRVFEIVFTQAFRQKTISPPPFGFSNHTTCKTSCNKSMVEFWS